MSQNESVVSVEKKPFPIVEPGEAWPYYVKNRHYLRSDYVGELVNRRGNVPLSLEEIQLLARDEVNENGSPGKETCTLCGSPFTPKRWLDIACPRFLKLVSQGFALKQAAEEAGVLIFGSFYLKKKSDLDYMTFCGTPYNYNSASQKYFVNTRGCLGGAKSEHPEGHWGMCVADLQFELGLIRQEEEEQMRLDEERKWREEEIAERQRTLKSLFQGNNNGHRHRH